VEEQAKKWAERFAPGSRAWGLVLENPDKLFGPVKPVAKLQSTYLA